MASTNSVDKKKSDTVKLRAYFAALPPVTRRELKKIRAAILSVAPDATDVIAYSIPGFRLDGRILIYYAAWKNHTSIYPLSAGMRRAHAAELKKYKTSKGTVQFPLTEPIPSAFIKRLVKTRLAEHRNR